MGKRITTSVGAVVLTAMTALTPAAASAEEASPDRTALVLCGTTCPTPDQTYLNIVRDQYVAPTHPGLNIDYVPVTTPEQFWPLTGGMRLLGLAVGDPRLFKPGGPAWPSEPWWKLTGLFDLTASQSLQLGAAQLEEAIAAHGGNKLVIYGLSQGAGVANVVKKNLAAHYPDGTTAPDIDFVLGGDPNLPNGGLMSRFPGLYVPVLDLSFNGAAATDTQFKTVEITRQYDGFTDFPLYPLNLVADLNAIMGVVYLHTNSFDVSLPNDPTTSPAYQGTYGDTSYYYFKTQHLPLFAPLLALGVPEKLIDVVEPFFRVLVEAGYDRSIKPWVPTPARLLPSSFDPGKLIADLTGALSEGIRNARALIGWPTRSGVGGPGPTPPAAVPSTASHTASSAKSSAGAVTASWRPTPNAAQNQAISPSRGSDHGSHGTSARHSANAPAARATATR